MLASSLEIVYPGVRAKEKGIPLAEKLIEAGRLKNSVKNFSKLKIAGKDNVPSECNVLRFLIIVPVSRKDKSYPS